MVTLLSLAAMLVACKNDGPGSACPDGQVLVDGECVEGGGDDTGPGGDDTGPGAGAKVVSAGWKHTCVLEAGAVTCFGDDSDGRLDAPDEDFVQIDAGEHTCGLTSGNDPVCWGPEQYNENFILPGAYDWITTGLDHACGVTSIGAMVCWGSSLKKQSQTPDSSFVMVDAGDFHNCGVLDKGKGLECWGWDDDGQSSPPLLTTSFDVVSAGRHGSCAITENQGLYCWGHASIEDGAPGGNGWVDVSVGALHACALDDSGVVTCWGDDAEGQASPPGEELQQISAGSNHTCGVTTANEVVCWGDDSHGQSSPS